MQTPAKVLYTYLFSGIVVIIKYLKVHMSKLKMSGTIYLSGGIQFSSDLGGKWRDDVSTWLRELNYIPLNITELDIAYALEHGDMYRALDGDADLLERKSNIRRQYIYADCKLIRENSDALIVYYDNSVRLGAGTISECQIAYDHELPIFLVNGFSNFNEVPGWLQGLSTKMFASFNELRVYFNALPSGILRRDTYGNHRNQTHYLCSLSGQIFEKNKTHFVSKISPLYSPESVEIVKKTHEEHQDRYEFFMQYLNKPLTKE